MITLLDATSIFKALSELPETSVKLPSKVNYARATNIRLLTPFIQDFENERNEVIRKYGTIVEESETGEQKFQISEENKDAYIQETTDLLNTEIDVPLVKFNIELLDNVELEPKIYDTLFLICEQ